MADQNDSSPPALSGQSPAGEHDPVRLPPEIERAIRMAAEGAAPASDAQVLAAIANRAIAELNRLARTEANARRGAADWGTWASLANAARDAVLKIATCRKVATDLARRT